MAVNIESENRVTRRDLVHSWLIWWFLIQANYNYERLQATGFAHTMSPIIRRLYHTPEDITAALKRHLTFFNTEPGWGSIVPGVIIAMEEQRANGADIDDDAINSVKTGLMGPLAGIGDTIDQGAITPILLALGIGIAGVSVVAGRSRPRPATRSGSSSISPCSSSQRWASRTSCSPRATTAAGRS